MTEPELAILGKNLERILEEQRAQRNEMRRLSEGIERTDRAVIGMSRDVRELRNDLELMIKIEIGGLFTHLETRLENYISEVLKEKTK